MGCISSLVQRFLFLVNFLVAVEGLSLLGLGCIFQFAYVNKLSTDIIPSSLNVVSILVIIVGSLLFVTSFLGCCGAIRKSVRMLRLYAGISLAVLIIQSTIGIYAFVKIEDSDFKKDVEKALRNSFQKYNNNSEYKDAIDLLQETMKCCGLYDASTWDHQRVPTSCCAHHLIFCSKSSIAIFRNGCFNEIFSFLDDAFTVFIAIGAAELLGAICISVHIARRMRERY